ncbi:CLUMA_CG003846, isoform A [Clunio marinus]|uniref:CLUMA_CG003846, isoform A n=1 Tax=Clunio marinus TaxID=568069 RepID=A0A1J1HPZ3_9DIPT|nr:CLUMA_CG003846, isoform A [Clunio marinus]
MTMEYVFVYTFQLHQQKVITEYFLVELRTTKLSEMKYLPQAFKTMVGLASNFDNCAKQTPVHCTLLTRILNFNLLQSLCIETNNVEKANVLNTWIIDMISSEDVSRRKCVFAFKASCKH